MCPPHIAHNAEKPGKYFCKGKRVIKCGPSYVKLPVQFSHWEYHGKKIFNYIWKDVYHILLGENNSIICIGV